jgi:hypothetical protein
MKTAVLALCGLFLASCATQTGKGQPKLTPGTQAALERLGITILNGLANRANEALKIRPQK